MCGKTALDEITERICIAAKDVLGGKLEKIILILICPHVVCNAVFRQHSDTHPFYVNVRREGIELYAA
jgi:hypothetical protein